MKFGIFSEHRPRPWNEGDEVRLFRETLGHKVAEEGTGAEAAKVTLSDPRRHTPKASLKR